jgi:dihydrofolate reductase
MVISLIVAASENNVIGKDNDLIWNLPADMKYFKEKTTGHHILMGRKNYESIPLKYRPLPNRVNLVVSRQIFESEDDAQFYTSIEDAVSFAELSGETELFIIGGGEIYKQSMDIANIIYITKVHHQFDGDTFFPEISTDEWLEVKAEFRAADENNRYDMTFHQYVKK